MKIEVCQILTVSDLRVLSDVSFCVIGESEPLLSIQGKYLLLFVGLVVVNFGSVPLCLGVLVVVSSSGFVSVTLVSVSSVYCGKLNCIRQSYPCSIPPLRQL